MRQAAAVCVLTLSLAVLSTGRAVSQTKSQDSVPAQTITASDVAHVYVGTTKGVYLYDATANGSLTLVSGSPFHPTGDEVGSNRKYFISVEGGHVYSYRVESTGAIGPESAQIDTESYDGGECGSITGAVLDHTGQNLYVQLIPSGNLSGVCVAYQTYDIATTSGTLTFNGTTIYGTDYPWQGAGFAFAITGSDKFAYATNSFNQSVPSLSAFRRENTGTLEYVSFNETDPPLVSGAHSYIPFNLTEDPTNHLAVGMATTGQPYQVLISYTVDSLGNIVSTNKAEDIPSAHVYPTGMQMSPSGKLLAVASDFQSPSLQVFHFNGAAPITPYSALSATDPINQMRWDNNDHLYALSDSGNKLYVYTVTPTSIKQAPGSPYTINGANALVVVPNLCYPPSSPGVDICLPAIGSSVNSPVLVEAASNVSGTIAHTQLWVDGVKKYSVASKSLNTVVSLGVGTHRFAIVATNTTGQRWESAVNATVR